MNPNGRRTHGHAVPPSPTYNSWRGMIERCKPTKQYGKLGITVCARWMFFEYFLADMGVRPKGTELDRKNVFDNYEPNNCRWRRVRPNRQHRRTTKLTPLLRKRIRTLLKAGFTHKQIAKDTGVSVGCVGGYIYGEAWR